MIQIPMTAVEFGNIEATLRQLNPDQGIELHEISVTNGNIVGSHPIKWSAEYSFSPDALTIHGHGLFGVAGKVETGLQEKLAAVLEAMRGQA